MIIRGWREFGRKTSSISICPDIIVENCHAGLRSASASVESAVFCWHFCWFRGKVLVCVCVCVCVCVSVRGNRTAHGASYKTVAHVYVVYRLQCIIHLWLWDSSNVDIPIRWTVLENSWNNIVSHFEILSFFVPSSELVHYRVPLIVRCNYSLRVLWIH